MTTGNYRPGQRSTSAQPQLRRVNHDQRDDTAFNTTFTRLENGFTIRHFLGSVKIRVVSP